MDVVMLLLNAKCALFVYSKYNCNDTSGLHADCSLILIIYVVVSSEFQSGQNNLSDC